MSQMAPQSEEETVRRLKYVSPLSPPAGGLTLSAPSSGGAGDSGHCEVLMSPLLPTAKLNHTELNNRVCLFRR